MAWTTNTTTWNLAPRYQPVSEDPMLVGSGPPVCSSSTELSVLPDCIFDVNGYYRDLGVSTRATRKELRLAYQSKDGQTSTRLTYVFKQLLDPQTRFEYDCTPLGHLFMDDYVRDMLNRKIKDQMSRRMADLAAQGIDLDDVDDDAIQRDIASEMGFEYQSDDTPDEVVDGSPKLGKDDDRPAKFEYAYYLWATRPRGDDLSLGRLSEWQRLLVSALAREGIRISFAVGLHGKPHQWVQALVGYRLVFFLNADLDPTEGLATAAARIAREQQQQHLAIANKR